MALKSFSDDCRPEIPVRVVLYEFLVVPLY